MESKTRTFVRMLVFIPLIAMAACSKKPQGPTVLNLGNGSSSKEFVVRVTGMDSFSFNFDNNSVPMSIVEDQEEAENTPVE